MPHLFSPIEAALSNGISVILHPYEGEVAAVYWWNRVGSADETAPEAGFAHFLEHMLFKDAAAKDTGKASTGKLALQIESLGGDINAYTSFEQTVYHVTCAAQHFERVLKTFGAMARPQSFLKHDFQSEREVILEELKKNEDSAGRVLFQGLLKSTFKKHPYGRPVIGFVKTLKAAKVQDLERFYRNHYSPERMGVVVVAPMKGPQDSKKILAELEKLFGSKVIPAKKKPFARVARVKEPEIQKEATVKVLEFDVQTPTISLSFRIPELMHPDLPGIDLLTSIVGSGEVSRLYQKLFYEKGLVTDASMGAFVPGDAGLISGSIEVSAMEGILPALSEYLEVLEAVKINPITPAEIHRVIVHTESEKLYALQSADGIASRLGFMKYVLGDLEYDSEYLSDLKSLTEDDLRRIAAKYFDPRRMSVTLMVPKGASKNLQVSSIESLISQKLKPLPEPKTPAKTLKNVAETKMIDVVEVQPGAQLARVHRPHSPVFSIYLAMTGGLRAEAIEKAGMGYLSALTWTKGTRGRSALDIAGFVEGKAAGLDAFSGRNAMGLQMTGLVRDFDALSELFLEVLFEPSFLTEELDRSKRIALDSLKSIDENSAQLCSKLFLETLFEQHPYGRMTLGTIPTVEALQSEDLREYHRRAIHNGRMAMVMSGAVNDSQFQRFSAQLADRLRGLQVGPEKTEILFRDEEALKAPRWVEKNLGREQIHVIVGGLGTRVEEEDRHAIRLLQAILGGQSGPLFIELREKKSLAYTVAPMHFEGIEKGYVGTYIACSPQKKDEAVSGIRATLEKVAKTGLTDANMKRAKEFLLGRRAMDLQTDGSLASHYGIGLFYGIHPRDEKATIQRIQKVSSAEIRRVMERYYLKPHMVTATVG